MAGRKPKPTALHALNGNPSKLDLEERQRTEPKFKPTVPEKPSWLIGEGRKMWKVLVKELSDAGVITVVDKYALAAACERWGTYVDCVRYIKKHGRTHDYTNTKGETNEVERPQVKIGERAYDQFHKMITEFGLTPSSKTKIQVEPPSAEDEMEDLLSG